MPQIPDGLLAFAYARPGGGRDHPELVTSVDALATGAERPTIVVPEWEPLPPPPPPKPVDCVSLWTKWLRVLPPTTPETEERTLMILRPAEHGGQPCPEERHQTRPYVPTLPHAAVLGVM